MNKVWALVIEEYKGVIKRAADEIYKVLGDYVKGVIPIKLIKDLKSEDFKKTNLIIIGKNGNKIFDKYKEKNLLSVCEKPQQYSVYVGESPFCPENESIAISGFDDTGILYGCMDFINKYMGEKAIDGGYLYGEDKFLLPFNQKNPEWKVISSPKISTRAVWTWGHVIYDYEKFFLNMAKLKLNEIVIWNDVVPFNAEDIIEVAHSYGIKVIWGFAWGWSTKCADFIKNLNSDTLNKLKEDIIKTYKKDYAKTKADGIYFQSFTETDIENVKDKSVAEVVVDLVNKTAGELLNEYPDLHIQFGLHATSVKNKLDIIAKTDKRVYIVWEDCGAFPYDYSAENVKDFNTTLSMHDKLMNLRGQDERFGAVLKGMINLDWSSFEHFTDSYLLGVRSEKFIKNRSQKKDGIRKYVSGAWLKNAEYALKIIRETAKKGDVSILEFLLEDALLEDKIPLFVAIISEMMWDPDKSIEEIRCTAERFVFVNA